MADWELVDNGPLDLGNLNELADGPIVPEGLRPQFRSGGRQLFIFLKRVGVAGRATHTVELRRNGEQFPVHYIVEGVQVGEEEHGLLSADLRDIPLRELVGDYLFRHVFIPDEMQQLPPDKRVALMSGTVPDVPVEVRDAWPNGDRDLVYSYVNLIYTAALNAGRPPTKTVGEKFGVSPSTGARLVKYARDAGVLTASSVNDPRKQKKDRDHERQDGTK